MSTNSTKSSPARKDLQKPPKPYPTFPLFPHASGCWSKKIRGKQHYFGSWRQDPDGVAAEKKFNREWPFLKSGRVPPQFDDLSDGCTIKDLANKFLERSESRVEAGELSAATFQGYFRTCKNLIDFFGRDRRVDDLHESDFADFRSALSKRLGVNSLKSEINKSRIIFKYALKQKFIAEEVDYGDSFEKPPAKVIRRDRREAGKRNFTREECLQILDTCDPIMRAMFLLGLNCGFGNSDCSSLPQSAIDWETGWVEHPRAKTEIFRRCKLWPETLETLRTALELRPVPLDDADADLIFLNKRGKHWVRMESKKKTDTDEIGKNSWVPYDDVTECFSRLLKKLGINGRRSLGFYSARRTFATAGSEAKDPDALRSLMGHSDSSQTGLYVQEISDERLQAVTDTVRSWLWPRSEKGGDA